MVQCTNGMEVNANPWTNEDLEVDEKADYVKYRDVGKKQYNYNSELYKIYLKNEQHESRNCNTASGNPPTSKISDCDYIWSSTYLSSQRTDNTHKYLYDTWLTSILFIVFTLLSEIGVAIFGLFLFLNKDESNHVPLK